MPPGFGTGVLRGDDVEVAIFVPPGFGTGILEVLVATLELALDHPKEVALAGITPVPGGKDTRPLTASTLSKLKLVVRVKEIEVIADPVAVVVDVLEEEELVSSSGLSSVLEMLSGEGNKAGANQTGTAPSGTTMVPAESTRTGVATPPIIRARASSVPAAIEGR